MQTEELYETNATESEADEFGFETQSEGESPFNEVDEVDLAAELLGVSSEEELDQFLGKVLRRAAKAAGGQLRSTTGMALGGLLKGAIQKALPDVGAVIEGAPPASMGEQIGSGLASEAGPLFGLQLEGLSGEDQEIEAAKQVVRLAGAAVNNAAVASPSQPPLQAAKEALAGAAQTLAPGLLRASSQPAQTDQASASSSCRCSHVTAGRWQRRGRTIILHGL